MPVAFKVAVIGASGLVGRAVLRELSGCAGWLAVGTAHRRTNGRNARRDE